jgi:glutamine synthetase adenylyltransferase
MEKEKLNEVNFLKEAYEFFRYIEAWLRFDLNLSISHLPKNEEALKYIAQRCGFKNKDDFMRKITDFRNQVRGIFTDICVNT